MSTPKQTLQDLSTVREQAESLLRALKDAKGESEKRLADLKQPDALKAVTGRTAMDNAIASTQRMIETLNRAADELKRELSEDELRDIAGSN
jgi:hypothetical protein